MFQNIPSETLELILDCIPMVVCFISIFVCAIVVAVKESRQLRKSEKQEKNDKKAPL